VAKITIYPRWRDKWHVALARQPAHLARVHRARPAAPPHPTHPVIQGGM
jgi:hypothetical protein